MKRLSILALLVLAQCLLSTIVAKERNIAYSPYLTCGGKECGL